MEVTAAASTPNTVKSDSSATKLADDFDSFLTLLTAQLQHQDPLEPMDTAAFTEQLVQFSSVEQAIATNKNLEELVALVKASEAGSASSYLGRQVEAKTDTLRLDQGGTANWNYVLPNNASKVTLTVRNEAGNIVHAAPGPAGKGTHDFAWNGKTAEGDPAPAGKYTLSVKAEDSAGNPMTSEVRIAGKVTAVDFSGTEPQLTLNGVNIDPALILTMSEGQG